MPVGSGWYPDPNPLAGIASTVGQIQQNQLFPLRQQALQLSNTGQQIQNTTQQTALQGAYTGNLRNVINSVPPPASEADRPAYEQQVRAAVQRSAGALYPQQMADAWFGGVGMPGTPSISDLANQSLMAAGNEQELRAGIGTPSTINTGTAQKTFTQKVGIGGVSMTPAAGEGANVPMGQSPEFQGAYVPIKRDDGSVVNVPRSEIETPTGQGIPNVQGPDGKPLTGPHGEVLGALPAGQEGALASGVQNQQDRANALQTAFDNGVGNTSAARKALLEEMRQVQGDFRSGPGAAKWAGIVTEFNRLFNSNFAADPSSAEQVFGKMAQIVASQQRDTLGLPATNAGEAAAELAAPNTTYSPKANLALIGQLEGNEDLLQTKQAAWTKFSKAGGQYNDFASQFNRAYDPRFFWDQYVPDERKAENGMTPAQKAEYERRRDRALALKF